MLNEADYLARLQLSDVITEEARELLPKRLELWIRCEQDKDFRAAVIRMCQVGTLETPPYLFFFQMFCTIHETRNPVGLQHLPFVPYDYQIRQLEVIHRAIQSGVGVIGKKTITEWLKSRDMGMTWLILMYFVWDFLFNKGTFLLGSYTEDEVDTKKSIATLFGKVRFILDGLPKWMKPADLSDISMLISYDNGEVFIMGQAPVPAFGRSKRVKATLMDEFQKWFYDAQALQGVSNTCNSVFIVGTPYGFGNLFCEIACKKKYKGARVEIVHWSEHPLKNRGMREIDGKKWSPWYQEQVDLFPPEIIAAEYDLLFETSVKGPIYADSYGLGHQKKNLIPLPGIPILRCWDPGGWSAVIFLQFDKQRRFRIYREVVTEGVKLDDIVAEVEKVSEELARSGLSEGDAENWADFYTFEDCGDPSGASTSKSNQEVPEYQHLEDEYKIYVDYLFMATMAPKHRISARQLAVLAAMRRNVPTNNPETDGPAFWIDVEHCPTLDEALRGGYRRKLDADGKILDGTVLEKHPYVDVADALGYGVVFKQGIPEQIKREAKRKTEEQLEDEEARDYMGGYANSQRSRC